MYVCLCVLYMFASSELEYTKCAFSLWQPALFVSSYTISFLYSSVGIATGLDGRGSIPGKARDFSLPHSVHAGSVSHPASCLMGTEGITTGA
jgi:hypothetical protein